MEELNIYQKLAKIRKPVEVLQKNKAGYGYKYVTEDLILAKITGLMEKLGVSLIPNIIRGSTTVTPYHYIKTKTTKSGDPIETHVNEILVSADMEWLWVNDADPNDRIVVPWSLVGQQEDASQAFGSGLSYASRYFMLKYFNVATSDDDPDAWRSMQKEAQDTENREMAKAIVENIHALVTDHIERKPEDRQAIYDITKKYARDAKGKPTINYTVITDPLAAGALLRELTSLVSGESKEEKEE